LETLTAQHGRPAGGEGLLSVLVEERHACCRGPDGLISGGALEPHGFARGFRLRGFGCTCVRINFEHLLLAGGFRAVGLHFSANTPGFHWRGRRAMARRLFLAGRWVLWIRPLIETCRTTWAWLPLVLIEAFGSEELQAFGGTNLGNSSCDRVFGHQGFWQWMWPCDLFSRRSRRSRSRGLLFCTAFTASTDQGGQPRFANFCAGPGFASPLSFCSGLAKVASEGKLALCPHLRWRFSIISCKATSSLSNRLICFSLGFFAGRAPPLGWRSPGLLDLAIGSGVSSFLCAAQRSHGTGVCDVHEKRKVFGECRARAFRRWFPLGLTCWSLAPRCPYFWRISASLDPVAPITGPYR